MTRVLFLVSIVLEDTKDRSGLKCFVEENALIDTPREGYTFAAQLGFTRRNFTT